MTTFTPTPEQRTIQDAFDTGNDLVVQAGAGTGKTSTLRMLATSAPTRRGLYIAFNKSIQTEAETSFPISVRARTMHSLAYAACGGPYRARMNAPRTGFGPAVDLLNIESLAFRAPDNTTRRLTPSQVARHVLDTVRVFAQSADTAPGPHHVPVVPGLDPMHAVRTGTGRNHAELVAYVVPRAITAWEELQQTQGVLRFDHSHYLKMYQLSEPVLDCDYLMFDEAQDASPVIESIVARQQVQKVIVGDSAQAIYGWAGAQDSMTHFAATGAQVLTLRQSFRFGPAIAKAANHLLDHLKSPLRLIGHPPINSSLTTLDRPDTPDADAVLCRTNAGALGEVMTAQNATRKVALVGGADDLRKFVEAAQELQRTGSTFHPDLMAFTTWPQVVAYVDDDPSGSDLAIMVDLVEDLGVDTLLRVLSNTVHESAADVVVSTAHKAKGREWANVRISRDFTLTRDNNDLLDPAEVMLAYVAITRAKNLLDPGDLAEWIGADPTTLDRPLTPADTPWASSNNPAVARPRHNPLDPHPGHPIRLTPHTHQRLTDHAKRVGIDPNDLANNIINGALDRLNP
jgi:hypothetical protein